MEHTHTHTHPKKQHLFIHSLNVYTLALGEYFDNENGNLLGGGDCHDKDSSS